MNRVIIDVREKDEFNAEHIADSIHIPLSQICSLAPAALRDFEGKDVLIMCRSGKRAQIAKTEISRLGLNVNCDVFTGGIIAWKAQGFPVITRVRSHISLMRQVQIVAGTLILSSVLLSTLVDSKFIVIAGFVGAGLTLAGTFGICPMALLLEKMPWNRDPNDNVNQTA